jgi:hypothetical protein
MIGLTAWEPYVQSRAQYTQSTVRRFQRWLNNEKILGWHWRIPIKSNC